MKLELDITTDLVCVWCYIGLHRLERALAQRPDIDAALRFHPFELNPDLDPKGMDRATFVAQKFGAEQWKAIEARLVATASAEGLPLDYRKIKWRPNTRHAHVLMSYARERGHGAALHRAITAAYFGEGRDIGDVGVLAELAHGVGIDRAEAHAALDDGDRRRAVATRADGARRNGIQGVPFFVINGRYAVSGAQETADWLDVFTQLAQAKS